MPAVRNTPITTKTPPKTICTTKPTQLSAHPSMAATSGRLPKAEKWVPATERKIAW